MKRFTLTILALMALLPLWADELTTSLTTVSGGWQLSVSLDNSSTSYRAFQLDVVLPSGVTFTDDDATAGSRLSGFTLQALNHPNGYVRVTAHNASNTKISGTSGVLFTLHLTGIGTHAIEDFKLHNCLFTTTSDTEVTLYLAGSSEIDEDQKKLNDQLQTLVDEVNTYLASNDYSSLSTYTTLNSTMTTAKNEVADAHATQETIDKLQSDFDAYKTAVDAYKAQKEAEYQALVEQLQALIAEVNTYLATNNYPSLSGYSALQIKLSSAQTAINDKTVTQSTIDLLQSAFDIYKKSVNAYLTLVTTLQNLMTEAQNYLAENDYSNVSGYTTLKNALTSSQTAIDSKKVTQTVIDQLQSALDAYKTAAEAYKAEQEAERQAQQARNDQLQTLVDSAAAVMKDELYDAVTTATQNTLTSVKTTAEGELSNAAATQTTIDALTAAIAQAEQEIEAERERLLAVTSIQVASQGTTYDLSGRRTRATRGIVIRGGKKYVVR